MGKKLSQREIDELHEQHRQQQHRQWWGYGQQVARAFAAGATPPDTGTQVFGPVLRPDEQLRLCADAWYGRLYAAGDGSWSAPGAFIFGNAAIVAGAVIGTTIARARARAAAASAAQIRWREQQSSSVIVTDQRLLCDVAERGWLSFWYSGVTEYHPNLQQWSVTLAFGDTSPLMLSGPAAAGIIAWSAPQILGQRWLQDPRLAPLLMT